jgi:hypothetical protein
MAGVDQAAAERRERSRIALGAIARDDELHGERLYQMAPTAANPC